MVVATFPLESRPLLRGLLLAAWLWLMAAVVSPAFAQGLVAVPQLTARVTDLTGTLAADQSSALEAKLRGVRAVEGQPGRGPDRADDTARGNRAVLDPCRRAVEAWPRQGRRRRAAARGVERPQGAHRGRLRPRRGAARCDRQPDHPAGHHARVQARRLLRRHQHRRRSHHARDRGRAFAGARVQPAGGRHPRARPRCCRSCSSSRWLAARSSGACSVASVARSPPAAWSVS